MYVITAINRRNGDSSLLCMLSSLKKAKQFIQALDEKHEKSTFHIVPLEMVDDYNDYYEYVKTGVINGYYD